MRQTLFFIPDELWGVPVFGFGWLLGLWVLGSVITVGYFAKLQDWNRDTLGMLPFVGLVAAAIAFLLPNVAVEIQPHETAFMAWQTQPEPGSIPKGLPIRGYGACLLVATISGVLLATYRAKKVGLSSDAIFGLAFHMFVAGIVGARVFFIIQYWDTIYSPDSLAQTLRNMVNFVEGGLVVYGSLIGALVGAVWFLRKQKLPLLPIADLVAPCLPLGLAIGRIGCLMNGCCYGGVCEQPWAITFPQHSPPYYDQQRHGDFYGFRLAENEDGKVAVRSVEAGSVADLAGLKPDLVVDAIAGQPVANLLDAQRRFASLMGVQDLGITSGNDTFHFVAPPLPCLLYTSPSPRDS